MDNYLTEHTSYFSCVVCNEEILDPHVLPCGEMFCGSCIEKYKQENNTTLYECKSCKLCFRTIPSICHSLQYFLEDYKNKKTYNEDLLQCSICLDILWKPVVLACGHCICFWCLEKANNRNHGCPLCRKTIKCKPKVVLKLHNFIIDHFPQSAERAKEVIAFEKNVIKQTDASARTEESIVSKLIVTLAENLNVSDMEKYSWNSLCCDGCGMSPIIGSCIYSCTNCLVVVGFDLCEECYEHYKINPTTIIGLYEQKHDPETHKFVKITPTMLVQTFTGKLKKLPFGLEQINSFLQYLLDIIPNFFKNKLNNDFLINFFCVY